MQNALHCTKSIRWCFNLNILGHPKHRLPDKLLPGSVDEQLEKDVQLVDSIAEKQAQIFSEECKLFPAAVQILPINPL